MNNRNGMSVEDFVLAEMLANDNGDEQGDDFAPDVSDDFDGDGFTDFDPDKREVDEEGNDEAAAWLNRRRAA